MPLDGKGVSGDVNTSDAFVVVEGLKYASGTVDSPMPTLLHDSSSFRAKSRALNLTVKMNEFDNALKQ